VHSIREGQLLKLPDQIAHWMDPLESRITEIVAGTRNAGRIFISGGGPQYATALEASLKLTEAALHTALPWQIEEAVHGSWASTQKGDLVIILAFAGPAFEKAQVLARGMKSIETDVWMITDQPDQCEKTAYQTMADLSLPELFSPLSAILPLYIYTYFSALERGIKPDRMRMDDPRHYQARQQMRSTVS